MPTGASTTNYPNGVTNAVLYSVMGAYVADDPSVVHAYWNDFDAVLVGAANAADWTQSGAGTPVTGLAAGNGGILSLATTTALNDGNSLQLKAASFAIVPGARSWFKCRFNISNATNAALTIGMIQTTTTPLTVTDGIWFSKAAASTSLNLNIAKASAATTISGVATLANTTYLSVGWHYNGSSSVDVYVNNVRVGGTTVLTNLPTANLNLTMAVSNGTAAANTMLVDYIGMFNERDPLSL